MDINGLLAEFEVSSVKATNGLLPWQALLAYYKLRVPAVPLGRSTVIVSNFKEYADRLPTKEELQHFIENARDAPGVAIVTGFRGLTAFDIDGEKAKDLFWQAFRAKFGGEPEELTWVERRVDPRDNSVHYHVYVIYSDFVHSKPTEGVKKIFKDDEGNEIAIVYRHWVRATPTFHEGAQYEWIHSDSVERPLRVSKGDFVELVRYIDPFYDVGEREDEFLSEEAKVVPEPDKDLTDEQIDKIVELVAEYWPSPGAGRGLFVLGMAGLLAYLGYKKDSVIKLVRRIFEEVDPAKSGSDLRRWEAEIEATYARVRDKRPISYRGWFRALGMSEEEIDKLRNEVVSIVRPRAEEFFKRELEYVLEISYSRKKVKEETGSVTYKVIRRKAIQPDKRGYLYIVVREYWVDEDTKELEFVLTKKRIAVSQKKIDIKQTIYLGDDVYVRLAVENFQIEGSIATVVDKLAEMGVISNRYRDEVKSFLTWISKNAESDSIYRAPGIYLDEKTGTFKSVILQDENVNLFPTNQLAVAWVQRLEQWSKRVTGTDYMEFLKAIERYKDFLEDKIYYVAMSYMAISPFFDAILGITSLKPILVLKGPRGSGKSELAKFIAVCAFGSEQLKQDMFGSSFREGAMLSASTFPLFIDDVDTWSKSALSKLKSTLTGRQKTYRGRPNQTLVGYEERTAFVMTSNEDIFEDVDPAFRDRLIVVDFRHRISPADKIRFRREISFRVGIGMKIYAHFFVPDLVRIANSLGGYNWMRETFIKYMEEADRLGITESRAPERFAILMLGAEILSNLLSSYGLTFDINEAKRAISEFFRVEEFSPVPEKLVNVVYAISRSISDEDLNIEFDAERDAYVIGMKELKVMQDKYSKVGEFPSTIKELATLIVNTFPDVVDMKDVYGYFKDSSGKRRVCFVPLDIYDYVLGYVRLETESYNKDEVKAKVIEELKEASKTFDELMAAVNVPERVLAEVVLELENEGVIWSANGYYSLRKKLTGEAKEEPEEGEKAEEVEETGSTEQVQEEAKEEEEYLEVDELIEKLFEDAEVEEKEFRWDEG